MRVRSSTVEPQILNLSMGVRFPPHLLKGRNDMEIVDKVIGMSFREANAIATAEGFTVRKVAEDGVKFVITAEYDSKRINLDVMDGKVVSAYIS
jgi:beta-lactam-binding protein with PASTA domain